MKWFNPVKTFFRDYIFSNLFDHYYKANDTYQDSEGKGIFERFIDVCSGYFDTEVGESRELGKRGQGFSHC